MISWAIAAAKEAGVFDAVIVSTDDEEIASVATANGAEAPFRRPADLANDHAATLPVIDHAIRWFEQNRSKIALACCIYATAPFLKPEFLNSGLNVMRSRPDAEFAFSVTSYSFPIFRSLKCNPDGTVSMFWPEHQLTRSQDLPEAWHDAGQFYWGKPESFAKSGIFSTRAYPVILPRYLVQDIDTMEDWETAERMFEALKNRSAV